MKIPRKFKQLHELYAVFYSTPLLHRPSQTNLKMIASCLIMIPFYRAVNQFNSEFHISLTWHSCLLSYIQNLCKTQFISVMLTKPFGYNKLLSGSIIRKILSGIWCAEFTSKLFVIYLKMLKVILQFVYFPDSFIPEELVGKLHLNIIIFSQQTNFRRASNCFCRFFLLYCVNSALHFRAFRSMIFRFIELISV